MEELLMVPEHEEIAFLYSLIRQDPRFLHDFDEKHFMDTALHLAAARGRTQLALEIQMLMPSFGRKLNPDGFTPIDLALQRSHFDTVIAMIKLNPELVIVKGREGFTPLHYAAKTDNVYMLGEFLLRCPDAINVLTLRGESAVHLAVKNRNLAAFKLLFRWLKRSDRTEVLSYRDLMDNTLMHLAAYTNQPEVIERLVTEVSVNCENSRGLTALDIIMELPTEVNGRALQILKRSRARNGSSRIATSADSFSSPITIADKVLSLVAYIDMGLSWQMRNAVMVVAVLIVTATYQAVLSPPGGFGDQTPVVSNNTADNSSTTNFTANIEGNASETLEEDDMSGKVVMPKHDFRKFMSLNFSAFAGSFMMIFVMLPFHPVNLLLYMSLFFLIYSYNVALRVISPPDTVKSTQLSLDIVLIVLAIPLKIIYGLWQRNARAIRRLTGSNNYYNIHDVTALVFHRKYSHTESDG